MPSSKQRHSRRLYALHSTPYTLHSTPYTLHPTLYPLHSTPYTLHPTLYTLHSTTYTLHLTLYALHTTLYTINSLSHSKFLILNYQLPSSSSSSSSSSISPQNRHNSYIQKNLIVNLVHCKFFTTFATDSYAGGSMSRAKCFAMGLSWVGFGHIKIAFIDALRLTN